MTFAGASVVDGFVTIRANSLTLNDLVRAAGTGKDVTIVTENGSVTLTGDGRIESESGDIICFRGHEFGREQPDRHACNCNSRKIGH